MRGLADHGGGVFYEFEELKDLAGAYDRVVADLGTVYTLSYRPTNKVRDGSWRAVRVNVNRANAVARGKRGYYAKGFARMGHIDPTHLMCRLLVSVILLTATSLLHIARG